MVKYNQATITTNLATLSSTTVQMAKALAALMCVCVRGSRVQHTSLLTKTGQLANTEMNACVFTHTLIYVCMCACAPQPRSLKQSQS